MTLIYAQLIATLTAGLWAGAAIYIGFSEHPSALKVSVAFATDYFRHMSKRTAPLMMLLSGLSGACGVYAWWISDVQAWLIGGLLQIAMFPLTAALIVPTNIKLIKINCRDNLAEAQQLHKRWGLMHNLRTLLGAPAFGIFLWQLTA